MSWVAVPWVAVSLVTLSLSTSSGCAGAGGQPAAFAGLPAWNPRQIDWRPYAEGMAEARAAGKPVVLIFYTDWCPHCHNYSRLFHDRAVVQLASHFVMIRVERDSHPDLSAQYDLDGEYIPRSFFLGKDGKLWSDFQSDNEEYRYFLDEHSPEELRSLMRQALERDDAPD